MRIVIFGLGCIYRENKEFIPATDEIVGCIDNNSALWETEFDGMKVFSPAEINSFEYDAILLMSDAAEQMREQLLKLGCDTSQIMHYHEYLDPIRHGEIVFYDVCDEGSGAGKSVLVITSSVGYHGGALVSTYLALSLKQKGYGVVIAAAEGDMKFVGEMCEKGIAFAIGDAILYSCIQKSEWVTKHDIIIVNTFPMFRCAIELGKYRDVFVWLHEASDIYKRSYKWLVRWSNNYIAKRGVGKVHVYAVSEVAKLFFEKMVTCRCEGILEYGIPDEKTIGISEGKGILTFALIGNYVKNKGQDILLDAIEKMDAEKQQKCRFVFIGEENDTAYCIEVKGRINKLRNAFILGQKNREEIKSCFSEIDVFVVASREETMSLVATEAMMSGKVCVVPDGIGMAQYITPYVNGLVYKGADIKELKRILEWCVDSDDLLEIGKNSRRFYETYFSLEALGKRAVRILQI